jgi:hypothetical protein
MASLSRQGTRSSAQPPVLPPQSIWTSWVAALQLAADPSRTTYEHEGA